jgi:hypothetical protein
VVHRVFDLDNHLNGQSLKAFRSLVVVKKVMVFGSQQNEPLAILPWVLMNSQSNSG